MSAPSLFPTSAQPTGALLTPGTEPVLTPGPGQVPIWRSAAVVALALFIGLIYVFNPPMEVEPQAGVVMDLPVLLGDYLGEKGEITPTELSILPKDTEFARRYYRDSHGHAIECSIVLSGAEQRSIHRPETCLTGQGWTVYGQETIDIPLASGHPLQARKLTLQRRLQAPDGGSIMERAYYVYWFVGQNVTTASEMHRVLLSNWDRVMHNRAHRWAYVSFYSVITDNLATDGRGLNAEETQKLLVDFAKQIVPTFQISEMPAQARN